MKRKAVSVVVNPNRIRSLIKGEMSGKGPVVLWMSRDQRVHDNWALLHAQELAISEACEVVVCFNLMNGFLGAPLRHYDFMLHGLAEVEQDLYKHNIDFALLKGDPVKSVASFVEKVSARCVVTDFSPLRLNREWKDELCKVLKVPFYEVDAHNVVPVWKASSQQETAARTIRPKLWAHQKEYFDEFPVVQNHPFGKVNPVTKILVRELLEELEVDKSVPAVDWIKPGSSAGEARVVEFLDKVIPNYGDRNNITKDVASHLSPYLHFGNISPQRVIMRALETKKAKPKVAEQVDSFVEELFIRRELSDNFCFYQKQYDSMQGAANWAKETLAAHAKDKREYVYSLEQFEKGKTHDLLWNAAQMEMVKKGKMHGFLRMYWCKKILEWAESPSEALRIGIFLNDKYSLDGRDPNGYVGVMWSICGIHDMGFKERDVFGKIRFMNYEGCVRKFKKDGITKYCKYVANLK